VGGNLRFCLKPPGCRVVRGGTDDRDRRDDARARVPGHQLRYAGIAARDDAHLGLPLSCAFFRMGGGPRS
jgi:hypothetical protein